MTKGKAEKLGFSPERLERIDRHFEEQVAEGVLPGAIALIARRGKVVYCKSFGMADMEAGKRMDEKTIIRLASMSKPIVSTAVMVLYEEGRFMLNDPVSKFIPEFGEAKVLVEVVSGMPLDRFLEERIFAPLKMEDTYFYLPDEKAGRLAVVYAHEEGKLKRYTREMTEKIIPHTSADYPIERGKSYFSGGSGLVAAVGDYARFCQMLLNGGELEGARILSRKTVELMTVDHVADPGVAFGLGFGILEDLGKSGEVGSVGSYSWGGYWGTSFWIDPQEDLVAVFMSQVQPTVYNAGLFQTRVYQALVK